MKRSLTSLYVLLTILSHASPDSVKNAQRYIPTKHFDLIHTDLKLKPLWKTHQLQGVATLTLKPYFYPQTQLSLDAKSFDIHEIFILKNGQKITPEYNYTKRKLNITLDRTYTKKDTLKLYISYTANPDSVVTFSGKAITDEKGLYFINTDGLNQDTDMHLWTQGETEANSAWFPTIDFPAEKHTQKIAITYEKNMVSLSNGKMTSSKVNQDGTKTDIWEQKLPHSIYLSVLVVGNFKIVKDKWKDKEVSYYMEPKYENMARPIFGRTPEMIEFFSKKLGYDFPWDKYSQVIVHDFVSGAMENTSAVTFNTMFQKDARELVDGNDDETIAHELFHHWFGDLVTCEDWAHLTLNESFANYSEYLWQEYKYGMDAAQMYWHSDLGAYMGSASRKKESLVRYDYSKPDDMFDLISYQKGGKILHMLRKYIGDEAFFAGLNLYLKRHAFKTAEYHDLKSAMEEITGEDLRWFFDQWYLQGGHPIVTSSYKKNGDSIEIYLTQKHSFDSNYIYRLPFDMYFYSKNGLETKRIVLDKKRDTIRTKIMGFQTFILDGTNSLVGVKNESKNMEDWITILNSSDQYLDQYTALKKLNNKRNKEEVRDVLYEKLSGNKDKITAQIISMIDDEWLEKSPKWSKKLVEIASQNKRGATRAAAIEKLKVSKTKSDFKDLIVQKLNDSSYLVEEEALKFYAELDSAGALDRAKNSIHVNSFGLLSTAFELIGKTEDPSMISYFEEGIKKAQGFKKLGIYTMLGKFITNMPAEIYDNKVAEFKQLAEKKDEISKYSGRYAINALKSNLNKKDDEISKKRLADIEAFQKTIKQDEEEE